MLNNFKQFEAISRDHENNWEIYNTFGTIEINFDPYTISNKGFVWCDLDGCKAMGCDLKKSKENGAI